MAWIEAAFLTGLLSTLMMNITPKRWTGVAATVAGAATVCRFRIAIGPRIRLWEGNDPRLQGAYELRRTALMRDGNLRP